MAYKIVNEVHQITDIVRRLIIDIVTDETGQQLAETIITLLADSRNDQIESVRVRAYADEEAVKYNGWIVTGHFNSLGDIILDTDNDPEVRKFLYEQGQAWYN